jgi:hypothetical protein
LEVRVGLAIIFNSLFNSSADLVRNETFFTSSIKLAAHCQPRYRPIKTANIKPVEKAAATTPAPPSPPRSSPIVGVYVGGRSGAINITDEFWNSPATTNWRADQRRLGLL